MDLNVAKYRTEKPSKSPPPPPPRRSFPSAHGLTTNRTGEVIVTSKNLKVRLNQGSVSRTTYESYLDCFLDNNHRTNHLIMFEYIHLFPEPLFQ